MGAEGDTNSLDQSFTKLNDVWNIVKDNKDEIYSKIIYGYDGKGGIWNFKLNVKIYDSIDKMIEVQNKYMTEKYNNLKTKETEIINKYKTFKKSKKYKQLISNGVNVVFKPTRKEVKLKNEKIQESIEKNNGSNDFKQILKESLSTINNKYINETYELVVNNKHTI